MKSLRESLLSINEANANGFIVIFEHESPDNTDIIKVSGDLKKAEKRLYDATGNDFMIYTSNLKHGLYYISHDDEDCLIKNLGVKSENELWDKVWKQYEAFMKENNYQYGEWVEVFSEDPKYDLLNIFDFEEDEAPKNKAELKKVIYNRVRDSYIDGDSSSADVIVDVMNEKTLFGGGMDITFYDGTVDDYIKEFWSDDEIDPSYFEKEYIKNDGAFIAKHKEKKMHQLFISEVVGEETRITIEDDYPDLTSGMECCIDIDNFKSIYDILSNKKPSKSFSPSKYKYNFNPDNYLYVSYMNITIENSKTGASKSFNLKDNERKELIKWLKDNM